MYKDELINYLKLDSIRMIELTFDDLNKAFDSIKNKQNETVNDDEIDAYHLKIESNALRILLKESIYSQDLRIVTGILKLVDDIERIGDHSEDLLWCTSKLTEFEKHIKIDKLDILLNSVKDMTTLTLKAYLNEDISLAKELINSDDNIDKLYLDVLNQLEKIKEKDKMQNLTIYTTLIDKYLERVADHLVNINEWIIYIKNGEYKGKVII